MTTVNTNLATETVTTTVRKRGRPLGSGKPKALSTTPKRSRGRPLGSKNKVKSTVLTSTVTVSE